MSTMEPAHRLGRWDVARLVIEDGETFAWAAAPGRASRRRSSWGQVRQRRWRAATAEDRASLACLQECFSRAFIRSCEETDVDADPRRTAQR